MLGYSTVRCCFDILKLVVTTLSWEEMKDGKEFLVKICYSILLIQVQDPDPQL